MKLPLSWLNEYVKVSDISIECLKEKLFSCGFEVEEVIYHNGNVKNVENITRIKHGTEMRLSYLWKKDGELERITKATERNRKK